jgi:Peptidase_C39 like family/Transglycosylase SLT domain
MHLDTGKSRTLMGQGSQVHLELDALHLNSWTNRDACMMFLSHPSLSPMPKLKAINGTLLKSHLADSSSPDLPSDFKTIRVGPGEEISYNWIRSIKNHWLFELTKPRDGRYNWYAFKPHFLPLSSLLHVPYFSQRDNRFDPNGTCNVTCCAMVAAFYGIKPAGGGQLEDEMYQRLKADGKDERVHANLDRLLKSYGLENRFSTEITWEEVEDHLASEKPVIISGRFTWSGHLVVIIGIEGNNWSVNDPYGRWDFSSRSYPSTDGKAVLYSKEQVAIVCGEQTGNRGLTWAHLPSKPAEQFDGLKKVIGIERTDRPFRLKVKEIAGRLAIDPNWLMACMSFESGGTFSPSIRNAAGSGATGLIQFMPTTARALGTSTGALARMSAVDQLDWVEKYFLPYKGKVRSLEDCYMAILWPAAIGKGNNFLLFRGGTVAYRQNSGLDSNRDGKITAGEAASKVRARFL